MDKIKVNIKESYRILLRKYYTLLGIILFLVGIALRLISRNKVELFYVITGDIGTFIAVTLSVRFLYNKFIKEDERKIFLKDLNEAIDVKLDSFLKTKSSIIENGRRSLEKKVKFIQVAKCEVIELGITLRSFSGYFEQRPSTEFKNYIIELLTKGVNFKCLALNPDCEIAKQYGIDRNEEDFIQKIQNSLKKLKDINDEFEGLHLKGKFEVLLYSHIPYQHIVCIDGAEASGQLFVSPYMYDIKRSETLGLAISKLEYPDVFEKYKSSLYKLIESSQKFC